MKKRDVLELKRRLKKDDCTFNRMCGCYVDAEKNIVLNIGETFLNLKEEEMFKYLDIAKKVLSGTIGNNLLELEFPLGEESEGKKQYELMRLKKSRLKDDELLNKFYHSIIDSYDYTGNFLILIFYDAYDIIKRTSDKLRLDESEEVYEYILCAICPVSLTKPGLRYFESDNRIGVRIRDWVVDMPNLGFIFPAFTDGSSDVNSIMYYTRNAKDPHPEIMEETLGCSSKRTAAEQKEAFTNIIHNAVEGDEEESKKLFMNIQDSLNTMIDEQKESADKDAEPIILTREAVSNLLMESDVPEEITAKIEKSYYEEFKDTPPSAEHLIDSKALAAKEQKKKEENLERKVRILERKLERANEGTENTIDSDDGSGAPIENMPQTDVKYDIVVKVKPEKAEQITSQIIDGQKCIIIPVDDNEQANVNGINTAL